MYMNTTPGILKAKAFPFQFVIIGTLLLFYVLVVLKNPLLAMAIALVVAMTLISFFHSQVALMILLFIIPQPWFNISVVTVRGATLETIFYALIIPGCVLSLIARMKQNPLKTQLGVIVFLFFFFNFANWVRSFTILSNQQAIYNGAHILRWAEYLSLVYLIGYQINKKRILKIFAVEIILVIIIVAAVALFRYRDMVNQFGSFEPGVSGARATIGGIWNVNATGSFLAFYTPLVVGILLFTNTKWVRIFLTGGFCLSAVAILYTMSRGSFAAIIPALLFIFFIKDKKLLCLFLILLALSPFWLPQPVKNRLVYRTFAIEESRAVLFMQNFQIYIRNPLNFLLGVGYQVITTERGGTPHSMYMGVLVDAGLPGLALFVCILVIGFKNGWYVYKNAHDKFIKGMGLGFTGTVVAVAVNSIASWSLMRWAHCAYFYALLGLIISARRLLQNELVHKSHNCN